MGVKYVNGELVVFIPEKDSKDSIRDKRLKLDVSTQRIAACNVCHANNFDNNLHTIGIGERVDRLYELQIGSMTMTLCDRCLDHLVDMILRR